MNEQQKRSASQALADHYHAACRIDDTQEMQFFRMCNNHFDGFFVSVNQAGRVYNQTVLMIETEDGWHIEELPWT